MTGPCSIVCRSIVLVMLVASTLEAVWAAPESPQPLTLEGAIQTALASHPELAGGQHEIAGAQARVHGAGALPSPELLLTPAGTVDDSQASLVQPLSVNGERGAASAAARAQLSSVEAQQEARRREIVFRARTAFYDVLAAQQERDAIVKTVELLDQIHAAAQKSFGAGDAPESHVMRTRIEVTRARQDLRLVEGEVAARLAALNTAMGRDAATPLTIQGDLPQPEKLPDPEALRAASRQQRPELAAAQADVRVREAETRLARTALRPDLVLQAQRASLRSGGGTIGVGLSLPFLDWGRRRAEIRQAEAAAQAERARLQQQQNTVALDVEEALARLQASAQVVESYDKGILADAERLAAMTLTGYQEGALNYLEVLDAQRALVETRRAAVQARSAYANARAALDRAVGVRTPGQ